MLDFTCDYNRGAVPEIINRLAEINLDAQGCYGDDEICDIAKEKIRKEIGLSDAQIEFLVGGTQTNQVVIDSMLRPFEGVIACDTGHVNVHEAGAIEFTGHKVLTVPNDNGKVRAEDVEKLLKAHRSDENREHMVFPGMVYISHPSELGTLYTKAELKALHEVCEKYEVPLYLDGARLGYGLACDTDVTLSDIAEYTDVFYIGGTKVGAFFGEAVVFTKNNRPLNFVTHKKQHGALLAKGWLLGVQFDTLFTNGLYYRVGERAMNMARKLTKLFEEKGFEFYIKSPSNQVYLLVDNEKMNEMKKFVNFSFWEKVDENHTAIRFVTSWATREEDIEELAKLL